MERPRRRLRGQSINRLIPNMLTVLALAAGLTAMRYGIDGRWQMAVVAILVAGVLDGLDGRIARLLGGATRFGAELDSLSDVISFGVAPAVLLYLWTMNEAGNLGFTVCLLFAICCALRLARFNARLDEPDPNPWAGRFFTGVPAPAGAGLALLPMMLTFQFGTGIFDRPVVAGPVLVVVATLMVSRLPVYSYKRIKVPHHYVVPTLLGVGLLAGLLLSATWATLIGVGALYLVNIPVSLVAYRRLRLAHEVRMRAAADDPEANMRATADDPEARVQTLATHSVADDPLDRDKGPVKLSSFEPRPGGRSSG